jgi:hypothetical protein
MALKLGVENRKQVAIAAVLGALVLFLVIRMLISNFGSPTPAPVTATPAAPAAPLATQTAATPVRTTTGSTATTGPNAIKVAHLGANLDPTLHFEVMRQAESLEYAGRGRNIFSATSAQMVSIPKVTRPIRPAPQQVSYGPPAPPPPPPIDLKFFGYSAQKVGLRDVRKAFLMHGEDVFIAAEGEVVDHRYRVVKISPFSIDLEDLPYHDTQTLNLTAN